jgi:tetratricopeptide (TPR) repeat protein
MDKAKEGKFDTRATVVNSETGEQTLKDCVETEVNPKQKAECASSLALLYSEGIFVKVNTKKAVQYNEIAYKLYPDKPIYIHNLGLAYYNAQSYKKATPLLNECVELDAKDLSDYNRVTCASKLGHIYYAGLLGKVDLFKAFNSYKFTNEFEPENTVYANNLANIAYNLGLIYEKGRGKKQDFNKAFEYYSIAYELQPNDPSFVKGIAAAHHALGNNDQAKSLFEKCFKAKVTSQFSKVEKAVCANGLGSIYHSEKLFDEAVKYLKIARELASNPIFDHNLAAIYMSTGNCQEAAPLFERCAKARVTEDFTANIKDDCAIGLGSCKLLSDEL